MSGVLAALVAASAPGVINGAPSGSSSLGAAGWELQNDGSYSVSNGGGVVTGDWVSPSEAAVAALYEVKVDATSGTFDSGATGSFLSLGTTRSWTKNSGSVTFNATYREIGTGIIRRADTGLTLTAP